MTVEVTLGCLSGHPPVFWSMGISELGPVSSKCRRHVLEFSSDENKNNSISGTEDANASKPF